VWGRIKGAEEGLGMVLVEALVDGETRRSSLTGAAKRLVADSATLRQRSFEIVEHDSCVRPSPLEGWVHSGVAASIRPCASCH
jgi:hypothetical protein